MKHQIYQIQFSSGERFIGSTQDIDSAISELETRINEHPTVTHETIKNLLGSESYSIQPIDSLPVGWTLLELTGLIDKPKPVVIGSTVYQLSSMAKIQQVDSGN